MVSARTEKLLLQVIMVIACMVPLGAGLAGMLLGTEAVGSDSTPALDNHFRYLSGLLLGIGVGFLTAVPRVELHTARVRLLTVIVVIGGMGRLYGMIAAPNPGLAMQLALGMELVVTPLLCMWQGRVARRFAS